ncbi:hypothetical protein KEU06_13750 [Pseudaminobacter sp. 19-2017]|uniref:Uncharacterized protein n=1 Tax=Pseudaminobacter soli (ex Zhang et al. 2022) TaxID=2831468 RepID=A0A942DYV6_9HYPH|nr:hypothetical protein [Pseudaminobacter soli]MBS3649672.1 hypothetical protein [Pseudaminobacter soli]
MLERADEKRPKAKRRILLRGKLLRVDDTDPAVIARSLYKDSPHAKREARLAEAEKKVARDDWRK